MKERPFNNNKYRATIFSLASIAFRTANQGPRFILSYSRSLLIHRPRPPPVQGLSPDYARRYTRSLSLSLSFSLLLLSPSRRFPRSMRTATEAVLSSLVLCHLLSQPASLIATGRFRAFCAHRWRRYAPTTVSFHLEFRSPRVLQGFAIDRHRPRSRYRSRSSRALEEEWRGEEWKRRERERRGERNLWCHSMPFSIGCQRTSAVFEMSDYSPLWEFNLFHRFQFVSFSFRIFLGGRGHRHDERCTWWERSGYYEYTHFYCIVISDVMEL